MGSFLRMMQSRYVTIFAFVCSYCFSLNVHGQQSLLITTNVGEWRTGSSMSGPFDGLVYPYDVCADYDSLQAMCPGTPRLTINTCSQAMAIWGSPTPVNCHYPIEHFFFQRKFEIDFEGIGECGNQLDAVLTWQADNDAEVYINGEYVGYSNRWNEASVVEDAGRFLRSGENEIIVFVRNTFSATCANYAFISLCLEIFPVSALEKFKFQTSDRTETDYLLSTYPAVIYWGDLPMTNEWYVIRRPFGSQDEFEPFGFSKADWLEMRAEYCYEYKVVRKMAIAGDDCVKCHIEQFFVCDEEISWNGDTRSSDGSCSLLDEYNWDGLEITSVDNLIGRSNGWDVLLSPNPVAYSVSVELVNHALVHNPAAASWRIYSARGEVIMQSSSLYGLTRKLEIDVSSIPAGVYALELRLEGVSAALVKRFVKAY